MSQLMVDHDQARRRFAGVMASAGLALVCASLTACNRESIVAYDIPKAPPAAEAPAASAPQAPGTAGNPGGTPGAPPMPTLAWSELPEGWTSHGPAGMRAANFTLEGPGGTVARMAVIPLPGMGGTDLELVNLWREELRLPPITEAELPSHTDEASIGGEVVRLFHVVRRESEEAIAATNQIITATIRRDGFTWFFKLTGPGDAVDAHRESLKQFLADVEIRPPSPTAAAASRTAATGAGPAGQPPDPNWRVPEGWEEQPATTMVHSRWSAADGAVDITVSVFPGDTGGLVANLNRWRRQVNLGPSPDDELRSLEGNLDVLGGRATLADFTGTRPESGEPLRVMGAVVPRAGFTWFYKIMGPPDAVESQRAAFVQFVQSIEYPSR